MTSHEIFMLTALVATGIFLLQFVISVFFGDLDMDVDGDANADFDLGSLFSFKGLVHFLIGFGWTRVLFDGDRGRCMPWLCWWARCSCSCCSTRTC